MNEFSEEKWEDFAVEALGLQDWQPLHGTDIAPAPNAAGHRGTSCHCRTGWASGCGY